MEYQVKPKEEGGWAAVTGAAMALTSSILVSLNVDTEVAIAAGALTGALVRPVFGYIISLLPKREAKP